MKNCSQDFKEEISLLGKQQDLKITYGNNEELTKEEINSASIFYEGNILKSMMKSLEIDCTNTIAIGTELTVQYGLLINDNYEYVDFGKFYVYKVEKQEDTNSYLIKCYDLMLNAMVNYDDIDLNINWTGGITVGAYTMALAIALGMQWNTQTTLFANSTRIISYDLYKGLGYTVRDVFDEISAVAGGSLCINSDNKLEMRYPTTTSQYTLDENYLKDVNVNFGESFGEVNCIVLSRSVEADNIYYPETLPENPIPIKITDNQIMNFNDRVDYLPELYAKLNGLNYYMNDYNSTGIVFLDYLDKYNVSIGNNTYNCLMLNDEINITQGLEELVHTDMPEATETDYTKADKTDRRINQTYIIIDKQNQKIENVITQVDEQNDKIVQLTETTDEIAAKVANMYNATKTIVGNTRIVLEKCIKGYILRLRIFGNNTVFDRLYPANDLYPANNLYPKGDSRIIVTDKNGNKTRYELRISEVLRANSDVYDEYVLEDNYAKVIRRVNADGTTKANEEIEVIGTYTIYLEQDTNTIEIENYNATLEAVYVEQNAYTDQFATNIEMESKITQTAEEINTEVRKKVGEDEVISKINQSAEAVTILANKLGLTANDIIDLIAGNSINLTSKNITINSDNFNVNEDGEMFCRNANISGTITSNNATITGGILQLSDGGSETTAAMKISRNDIEGNWENYIMSHGINISGATGSISIDTGKGFVGGSIYAGNAYDANDNTTIINGNIYCVQVTQRSKESIKKNIKLYDNRALDIILNSKIYEYNFKSEDDNAKKHIGFVIGDEGRKYETPKEVISSNKEGIENYTMASILWKGMQEQQEIIKKLQQEIKELKEGK